MNNFTFSKNKRLLKRSDYKKVYKRRRKLICKNIIINFSENRKHNISRLGITITKKQGKSFERNRFKRIVREAFRLYFSKIPKNIDINVQPKNNFKTLTTHDILEDLQNFSVYIKPSIINSPKFANFV